MNKFLFFFISLIAGLLCCSLFAASVFELFSDNQFVDSLNLPPEADSLGIPIFGGFAIAAHGAILIVLAHIILLILCFTRLKNSKIFLKNFLFHKEEFVSNIIRALSYALAIYLFCEYLFFQIEMETFFKYQLLFHLNLIFIEAIFTIWIVSIFRKRINCHQKISL